ncbi:hypothetical protein K461DRAFT_275493 [Myriangium duriaei CBS 260.36]|uniref:Uncharacterized protein n=1 Tax=Myriangium duriaei CBS 260.36 TaxID=1168546 RepID=A0A9P4MKL3_9PEZI|nr:hypothetical protein K461DRAFT_275493 [Myriangium duriaei CBS 260.36]
MRRFLTSHDSGSVSATALGLANSTAGRVLACTALLWLIAFATFRQTLWRDPHTAFFQDDKVYDLGYSLVRQEQARSFVHDADRGSPALLEIDRDRVGPPVVCAAVTTFKRDKQYLNETIGSMLVGLTPEERSALDVRLLFAHAQPEKHPDWNATWLRSIDLWSGYNVSKEQSGHLQELEDQGNFYEKGVRDYMYTIQQCQDSKAPYIAVFEDDIIFADGWLAKTLSGLAELRHRGMGWLYMRLFYTETSLGWDETTDYWYRHMPLTFGLAMISGLVFLLVFRRLFRLRRGMDNLTVAVLVLIAIPAFTALTFMAGKYNLRPIRGVVKMNKDGCCTQALVFPRAGRQFEGMMDMLSTRTGQTDALIEEYANTNHLDRWALGPQVVQHVGLVSSRNNLDVNTKSTWAFWFEAQRSDKLKTEHEMLARAGGIWREARRLEPST